MTMPQDVIGVDVSKDFLDCHRLSDGRTWHVATSRSALRGFATAIASGTLVVFEPTGGYERPLATALDEAGVSHARVNAQRTREFARAAGRLAKTDRVDAAVLAEFGAKMAPRPTPREDPATARLAELVARRDVVVVEMRKAEKQRMAQARDGFVRRQIATLLKSLDAQLARLERAIEAHVGAEPELAARSARLRTVPGLGPKLTAALLARLPELGRLDRRAIASLAGFAPHACDSGAMRGRRHIRGGRPAVRRILNLAAFVASRCDARLKACRAALQAAGKPFKLAICATARKLLTIINAMLRDATDYAASPA